MMLKFSMFPYGDTETCCKMLYLLHDSYFSSGPILFFLTESTSLLQLNVPFDRFD